MRQNVIISYRGLNYELGHTSQFYGLWAQGTSASQPLEWWPKNPEGWTGAWARFNRLEAPSTIVAVQQRPRLPFGARAGSTGPAGLAGPVGAAALLAVGVALGVAGLFPSYVSGQSLASQAPNLWPHVLYLAGWATAAALIWRAGMRSASSSPAGSLSLAALFSAGLSVVTLGFFVTDLGTAVSGGTVGAGLVLALVGWAACAAGSWLALWARPAGGERPAGAAGGLGRPRRPRGHDYGVVVLVLLAAAGAAAAFAPSWDSFTLHTALGQSETLTTGNAFAEPWPVITGNVVVMVTLVAVAIAAALWRPHRQGAALLAGAVLPMIAQGISAFIQFAQATPPAQFGFSQAQASAAGLTISNGLTPVFWVYCVFVFALAVSCAWMFLTPTAGPITPSPAPVVPAAWDDDDDEEDDDAGTAASDQAGSDPVTMQADPFDTKPVL